MVIKTIEKNKAFGEEDNFRMIKEDLRDNDIGNGSQWRRGK